MKIIEKLKSLPIDVGQGSRRFETKGKLIALSKIPKEGLGKKLLDVGCREGAQSKFFESLGYQVTSIDVEKVYEKTTVVDCNEKLPWDDETFDVIWSSEVLEHLIDPGFSLSEARRVVKPGGMMVYTVPNSFPVYFCLLAAVGLTPQRIQRSDHLQFFDLISIKRLFPSGHVFGFLPFSIKRPCINRCVGLLSPTFVVIEKKPCL